MPKLPAWDAPLPAVAGAASGVRHSSWDNDGMEMDVDVDMEAVLFSESAESAFRATGSSRSLSNFNEQPVTGPAAQTQAGEVPAIQPWVKLAVALRSEQANLRLQKANVHKVRIIQRLELQVAIHDDASTSPREKLVQLLQIATREEESPAIDVNSKSFASFVKSPDFVNLVLDYNRNPLSFNLQHHIDNGTLVPAGADLVKLLNDKKATAAAFSKAQALPKSGMVESYMRVSTYPTTSAFIALVRQYAKDYPGDPTFPAGILAVIDRMLDRDEIELEDPCSLSYEGQTYAGTALTRALSTALDKGGSRVVNFELTEARMPEEMRRIAYNTYTIPALAYAPDPSNLLADDRINALESMRILLRRHLNLNSCVGGMRQKWDAPAPQRALVNSAQCSLAEILGILSTKMGGAGAQALGDATVKSLRDNLQYLEQCGDKDIGQLVDVNTEEGRFAMHEIEEDARAPYAILVNGEYRVAAAWLWWEITLEGVKGISTFNGAKSAKGPEQDANMTSLVYSIDNTSLEGSRRLAPLMHMFCLGSAQKMIATQSFFIMRYLRINRPLVIISQSSLLADILKGSTLQSIAKSVDPILLEDFLATSSPTTPSMMKALIANAQISNTSSKGSWLKTGLGKLCVVMTGPGPQDLGLLCPNMDPGLNAYDPVILPLLRLVRFYVALMGALATKVVLERVKAGDGPPPDGSSAADSLEWFRMSASMIETRAVQLGIQQHLQVAQAELADLNSAINSARGLSGNSRSKRQAAEAGFGEEYAAEQSAKMTEHKARVKQQGSATAILAIGRQLTNKEIGQLRAYFIALAPSTSSSSATTLDDAEIDAADGGDEPVLDVAAVPHGLRKKHPRLELLLQELIKEASDVACQRESSLIKPGSFPTGSWRHVQWYLNRKEGVNLKISAGATAPQRTEADEAHYRKVTLPQRNAKIGVSRTEQELEKKLGETAGAPVAQTPAPAPAPAAAARGLRRTTIAELVAAKSAAPLPTTPLAVVVPPRPLDLQPVDAPRPVLTATTAVAGAKALRKTVVVRKAAQVQLAKQSRAQPVVLGLTRMAELELYNARRLAARRAADKLIDDQHRALNEARARVAAPILARLVAQATRDRRAIEEKIIAGADWKRVYLKEFEKHRRKEQRMLNPSLMVPVGDLDGDCGSHYEPDEGLSEGVEYPAQGAVALEHQEVNWRGCVGPMYRVPRTCYERREMINLCSIDLGLYDPARPHFQPRPVWADKERFGQVLTMEEAMR